jgi:hypothetical protein
MKLFAHLSPFERSIGPQCSYCMEKGSQLAFFMPIATVGSDRNPNVL